MLRGGAPPAAPRPRRLERTSRDARLRRGVPFSLHCRARRPVGRARFRRPDPPRPRAHDRNPAQAQMVLWRLERRDRANPRGRSEETQPRAMGGEFACWPRRIAAGRGAEPQARAQRSSWWAGPERQIRIYSSPGGTDAEGVSPGYTTTNISRNAAAPRPPGSGPAGAGSAGVLFRPGAGEFLTRGGRHHSEFGRRAGVFSGAHRLFGRGQCPRPGWETLWEPVPPRWTRETIRRTGANPDGLASAQTPFTKRRSGPAIIAARIGEMIRGKETNLGVPKRDGPGWERPPRVPTAGEISWC